jgi:hypothetical protein
MDLDLIKTETGHLVMARPWWTTSSTDRLRPHPQSDPVGRRVPGQSAGRRGSVLLFSSSCSGWVAGWATRAAVGRHLVGLAYGRDRREHDRHPSRRQLAEAGVHAFLGARAPPWATAATNSRPGPGNHDPVRPGFFAPLYFVSLGLAPISSPASIRLVLGLSPSRAPERSVPFCSALGSPECRSTAAPAVGFAQRPRRHRPGARQCRAEYTIDQRLYVALVVISSQPAPRGSDAPLLQRTTGTAPVVQRES